MMGPQHGYVWGLATLVMVAIILMIGVRREHGDEKLERDRRRWQLMDNLHQLNEQRIAFTDEALEEAFELTLKEYKQIRTL